MGDNKDKQRSFSQRVKKIQQIVLHLLLCSPKVFSTLDGIAFMQLKEHDSLQKWNQQANLSGRNGPMIIRRGQHRHFMRGLTKLMPTVKMVFLRNGCQSCLPTIDVYATGLCKVIVYLRYTSVMYFIAVSVRPKKNQLKTYTLQCSRLLLRCQ